MYTERSNCGTVDLPIIETMSSTRFFRYESNKENSPRNSKKSPEELTADAAASDSVVQRARAELRVLEQERSRLEKQRKSQLKDFEASKSDARRLLEVNRRRFEEGKSFLLFFRK